MEENITDFAPTNQLDHTKLKAGTSGEGDELIGQIVAETFELLECIGQGGIGVVYRARHIILEKPVALKLLSHLKSSEPEVVARFRQEAVAISSLDHPNIVRLNAFGVDGEDRPYLVMDLVEGRSLSDLIKARGKLSPGQALQITSQILAALMHAHTKNIIHRDIKPSNIMVREQDDGSIVVKVVDFGLAKVLGVGIGDGKSLSLTKTGEMLGSPHYMSPEQCTGDPLDQRSDLYSTGCVLYEMVSGHPPFDSDNMLKVLHLHATGRHSALIDAEIPGPVLNATNKLLDTAMAKDVGERYASAGAMLKDVQSILDGAQVCDRSPALPASEIGLAGQQSIVGKDYRTLVKIAVSASITGIILSLVTCKLASRTETQPSVQATAVNTPQIAAVSNTLDLQNLSIVDPDTAVVFNFSEKLDSRQQQSGLLPAPSLSGQSIGGTVEGGIPMQIPPYDDFKKRMQGFAKITGRSYSVEDRAPIMKIADFCYECGDMGRALCLYQKLLTFGNAMGAGKANLTNRVGDCYAYFNRYNAANKAFLEALEYYESSNLKTDQAIAGRLYLKLAVCANAVNDQKTAKQYAQKALDTTIRIDGNVPWHIKFSDPMILTTLGDASWILERPTQAHQSFVSARKALLAATGPSLVRTRKFYSTLLDLRIARAQQALGHPQEALKTLQSVKTTIESFKESPAPPNEPTMRAELLPRIYYLMGSTYNGMYRRNQGDLVSRQLALTNFDEAMKAHMAAYQNARSSALAASCLAYITLIDPDYEVSYPDGKRRAINEMNRISNEKYNRPILMPLELPRQ